LADMLHLGRLPEAWIAPPAVRELRESVRYRAKLVALRSGLKAQVHAERRQRRPTSWSPAQSEHDRTVNEPVADPSAFCFGADGNEGTPRGRFPIAGHLVVAAPRLS
jgi:hypothetical protein